MSENSFAEHRLDVGQIFEGKYQILRELGRGGFGMVYLAFQQGMDRHVALKVLKPEVSASAPNAKLRFLREVKIISKLRHPNTVTIHDFGETRDGVLYMVLEYVEGETLKQLLKREGAQNPVRAGDIARQVAKSLAEAHRHGIVHRDLKPANIMITDIEGEKDFVKVLDFGVARLLDPKTNDLTSVGLPEGERELVGTPRYMSPEQVRGESLTGASDIYSLGLMLYETLVGEPAVQGDTTMGLITQQISPEPLPLPKVHHLDPMLQDIVRIATAKPAYERFQTAEQMSDALEQASFQMRRAQNMGAAPSGEFLSNAYESQLTNMQPPPGGPPGVWSAGDAGYSPGASTPTGAWPPQTGPRDALSPGPSLPLQDPLDHADYRHTEHPSGEAIIPPFDELPAPEDANPFDISPPADEAGSQHDSAQRPRHTRPQPAAPSRSPPPHAPENEDLLAFSFGIIKMLLLGTSAVLTVYVAFLIVGSVLGDFVQGTLRLAVALLVTLAIPGFTALGENSQREHFRVVDRPFDRVARVFVGTIIFSAAAAVLVSAAFANDVVRELRDSPNWFVSGPERAAGLPELNRRISHGTADFVESATRKVGLFEGAPAVDPDLMRRGPTRPPAPTRPATQRGE